MLASRPPDQAAIELVLGAASHDDIYLSPHSDDICFSLGCLARQRLAGSLITVFPISFYRADQVPINEGQMLATTRQRLMEDAAFAQACGLSVNMLDYPDALARGQGAFDSAQYAGASQLIQGRLIAALMGPTVGRRPANRPWLFCPAGIGAHVDHLAVLSIVARGLRQLRTHCRVAFYEDLHYAANSIRRERGLEVLRRWLGGHELRRCSLVLDHRYQQESKLQLVGLYGSQLTPAIRSIRAYTPAVPGPAVPHEALWMFQEDMHQLPG
jgi:hypothetical protein